MLCRLALVLVAALPLLAANPTTVTIPGSFQETLGCPGPWDIACNETDLDFDADDDVWQKTFDIPAGSWEYKAALNHSWDENYGANAQRNGANIGLNLATAGPVKFYYDHKTHWVTDNRNSIIVTAPGSYLHEIGCGAGDWMPDCLRAWLQDPDGDGTYTMTAQLPAGSYEVKITINESWTENYGAGGVPNGPNISFTVATDCQKTLFSYDATTHILNVGPAPSGGPQPGSVTIFGSFQDEAGCPADWRADCANTHLTYDGGDGVWQERLNLPAGNWEYKAAINDTLDENYGANATANGANIPLHLSSAQDVKFYYDHSTHWVADDRSKVIATAVGSFQSELGCPGDWQPDCLRSWLQDPDGDGIHTFTTTALAQGNYEAKIAINESWSENYGAGGARDGANIAFSVPRSCAETLFSYNAASHVLTISASGAPKGNLTRAQAHWVASDLIAWSVDSSLAVALHASASGGLQLTPDGVTGGTSIPLTYEPEGLPASLREKFPHLAAVPAWRIPSGTDVAAILKGQIAVSAEDASGALQDATSLQIPGVLDDLYAYSGSLGVAWSAGVPAVRLWAPTARNVTLRRFANSTTSAFSEHAMTRDVHGVWSVTGDASWMNQYYLYDVEVFVPTTGTIEHNVVTDPYSFSLARNSTRTQIVDLSSPALKPAGWDTLTKPPLDAPEDITLYELHVRDFSANDDTVPVELRGTFKAFTRSRSRGMKHLAALATSGLTHVQLLPSFDFTSVNEDKADWLAPAGDLSTLPPDSEEQQARVAAVQDRDAFHWGYEPWHFTVPEGSYATDPDGPARILEFREMVQALADAGLRTVMDVAYSHTSAAGQNDRSVLDRIVPGYYHRLNADGNVETSSCCQNTASEHVMMEKLLIDSVLTWVTQYKVDGFRFDLMGHHMKRNLLSLRTALDALGPEGQKVYLFGEGWNFGEVANNARGVNATQANMAGTGIGTFDDRLRDGVRGGSSSGGLQAQGFASGLYVDPNETNQGSPADQKSRLLLRTDWIRTAVAGSLAQFTLVDRFGNTVTGSQIDYNGQPAGSTADPQEAIHSVESHDNQTLFDALQVKLPVVTTAAERVRAQNLALAIVSLAEGIPLFHAGGELLRSKSLDGNSYNSGDWFNRLDFTYATNNWGVGLPPAAENQSNWPLFAPLLANPALKPATDDIRDTLAVFREFLAIRRSTKLFRLRTAADVQARVHLLNGGPDPVPALIVMTVSDENGAVDRQHDLVAVVFNANPTAQTFTVPSLALKELRLHPIQVQSSDSLVPTASCSAGTFTVPRRTAAVFWSQRPLVQQLDLLLADVTETSLRAPLLAARNAVQQGDLKTAKKQLQAFIKQVQAVKPSNAAALIAEANAILAEL